MSDRPTKRDITAAVNFLINHPHAGTFIADMRKLTWAERNAAAAEFWAMVDRNLDAAIEQEKRKGLG